MIQLIKELREALPDKVIVINRGFSLLKEPEVSSNIDGLMFESFSDSYDFDTRSYICVCPQDMDATRRIMENDVLPAVKQYKFKVLHWIIASRTRPIAFKPPSTGRRPSA